MKYAVAALRLAVSALMLVAMTRSFVHDATHGVDVWPWDWFGYFTNQNNLAAGFMLTVAAVGLMTGRRFRWLDYVRGAVTTYIVIVGGVFWTLLAPVTVVAIPWTNDVMHAVMPAYCLLDWLLVGDREPLAFSKLWVIFPYAVVWLGVTLVRGATDGWVPYPFMDPKTGYASVAMYCGAIVVIATVFALAFWGASRWRGAVLRQAVRRDRPAPVMHSQRIAS
ncbi:Pr6Pr family membrane protein [Gryllotalpicola reticulitermitis]|uniref:Pr6Pr family membrane protein n=1 Tax=Gryllotalpicola reticulitermitis TaxID=1184153 RepID=A0ABV8Q6T6_9MICO